MLAKDPHARPSAEVVYDGASSVHISGQVRRRTGTKHEIPPGRSVGRCSSPRSVVERSSELPDLTDADADLLMANVRALLGHDRPSEAINLLEDGIARASHDSVLELQLRHLLAAATFYAGEYTRAASLFDVVGRDFARYLPPTDFFVLDSSYHAGHAYAEIGKPEKALAHLRFYVQNADTSADQDEADKVLESRFVIAQMLATSGHPDEALSELEAIRPLLAQAFGPDSTQIRNLDKQISRLRLPTEMGED